MSSRPTLTEPRQIGMALLEEAEDGLAPLRVLGAGDEPGGLVEQEQPRRLALGERLAVDLDAVALAAH